MNERPITRIVPQKGSEVLHLHMDVRDLRPRSTLKCYTPIPSGGSIGWDSRSIATQTSQEDDEERKSERSGRSRWRRSAMKNKRKSIAVMETNKADKEVEQFTNGRAMSTSPSRRRSLHVPQMRSKSVVPPSATLYQNYAKSSSVDNLLGSRMNESSSLFLDRYHRTAVVSPSTSDARTVTPSENMIRSKTVRAEKRKQRDKQLRAQFFAQPPPQAVVQPPAASLPNLQYFSPNHSGNSSSSLSGSANTYNQRLSMGYGHGLMVKPPAASYDNVIDRHFPKPQPSIMDKMYNDGKMVCARAEPYTPSVTSSVEEIYGNSGKRWTKQGEKSAIESFRLLGLLLPPENRRKLQLLLKFHAPFGHQRRVRFDL